MVSDDQNTEKYFVGPVFVAVFVTLLLVLGIGLVAPALKDGPLSLSGGDDVAQGDPYAAIGQAEGSDTSIDDVTETDSEGGADDGEDSNAAEGDTNWPLTIDTIAPSSAAADSLEIASAVFSKAPTVVVADLGLEEVLVRATAAAFELRVPLLLSEGTTLSPELSAELDRLEVEHVLTVGNTPEFSGRKEIVIPVASEVVPAEARNVAPEEVNSARVMLVSDSKDSTPALSAAASALGLKVTHLPGGDPRVSDESVKKFKESDARQIVAFGESFEDSDAFERRVLTAKNVDTLPGGGQLVFGDDSKMVVALYGSPGTPSLGLLGEQELDGAVARAKDYAAKYAPLTEKTVIPGFEIITTVASGSAGEDGDYSYGVDPSIVESWIKRAEEEGIYVVLDLQPGRSDFLTQAKEYESLLKYPNVGLALDPEWRLKPNQKHLRQIGSVGIEEVNSVHEYLTTLVRENNLPQKLLILHQFRLSMIRDRDQLTEPTDEIAVAIHVDGQGPTGAKINTWNHIREDAPEVKWGWKNFIDEDIPMLTPEGTMEQVDPLPDLVTYQ